MRVDNSAQGQWSDNLQVPEKLVSGTVRLFSLIACGLVLLGTSAYAVADGDLGPNVLDNKKIGQLQLMDYSYSYRKRELSLDSHLNLTFERIYDLVIRAKRHRPIMEEKINYLELLAPGEQFRLRGVFASTIPKVNRGKRIPLSVESLDDLRYLAGFEQVVSSNNKGEVMLTIVLPVDFTEEPSLESRVRLFLEITPLHDKNTRGILASSAFQALEEQGWTDLLPSRLNMDDVLKKLVDPSITLKSWKYDELTVTKARFNWEKTPQDLFLTATGLDGISRIDLNDRSADLEESVLTQQGWNADMLRDFITSKRYERARDVAVLLKSLCPLEGRNRLQLSGSDKPISHYDRCLLSPSQYFQLSEVDFVESVNERPVEVRASVQSLGVSSAFMIDSSRGESRSRGEHSAKSVSRGVSARAGLDWFGMGAGLTGGWNYSNDWVEGKDSSVSTGTRNYVSVSESRSLQAQELQLDLNLSVKSCLFLRALAPSTGEAVKVRHMICLSQEQNKRDSWYYIAEAPPLKSAHQDPKDLRTRDFLKLVRGRAQFERVKQLLADSAKSVVFSPIQAGLNELDPLVREFQIRKESPLGFVLDGGIFPGVLEMTTPR